MLPQPRTSSLPLFLRRRPGLAFVGLVMAGTGLGFKYVATTIRNNELAQKNDIAGHQNLYVTVDRSGGGI
ncbi:hypothetical protein B0T22DRAFT_459889 [Podospora appendiculata]|uniref:Uncharacterized protein n=1 Tax=Podospora appendiculata TaxID=314037 RepID=A0AAE0XA17_9PEZI|nr:hypothetical protein B0T22DRAFT_459889 [Podospora appendiculata]